MGKVMMTIHASKPPSLDEILQRYGLSDEDVDRQFGVVEVDPEDQLYTFMVEEQKASRVSSNADWQTKGPYANPRIAPFGPPEP